MSRLIKQYFRDIICFSVAFSIFISPFSVLNAECECYFCDTSSFEEELNYSLLGDYENGFKEFDRLSEEDDHLQKTFFIKKWCQKVRSWFKKNLFKLIKSFVHINVFTNGEQLAFDIAHIKIKIDKRVHHTGHIEDMLSKFETHTSDPAYKDMNLLTDRIRYYYTHPNAKPVYYFNGHPTTQFNCDCSELLCEKNHIATSEQLKDIPPRALLGSTGVACGILVCAIPLPGCRYFGTFLITTGAQQIYEGYMQKYEEDMRNRQGPRIKPSKRFLLESKIEAQLY